MKNSTLALAIGIIISVFVPICSVNAQAITSYQVLHSFGDGSVLNDGLLPQGSFVQDSDGNFYSTTYAGGATETSSSYGAGTLFRYNPSTQVETVLHSFGDGSVTDDAEYPYSTLTLGTDGNVYGTTLRGGSAGIGTVFEYSPSTQKVTILHSFGDGSVENDGASPSSSLIQASDGNLYGTTPSGGSAAEGTIFEYNLSTAQLTILHSFGDGSVVSEGFSPAGALIQATDGNLYGTTFGTFAPDPGSSAPGSTIFEYNLTSHAVTVLHHFSDGTVANDGINPASGLLQAADGNFYGTTMNGGPDGAGTLFEYSPTTQKVTILYTFGGGDVWDIAFYPFGPLIQAADGNLYGTTNTGGFGEVGTIFAYSLTTQALTILHAFQGGSVYPDGVEPISSLFQTSDGNIYGMTPSGGSRYLADNLEGGTLFRLTPGLPGIPSRLTAVNGTNQVTLAWDAAPGASSYDVYEGTSKGGEGTAPIATNVPGASYAVTGLTDGATYYFRVTSFNGVESSASNEVSGVREGVAGVPYGWGENVYSQLGPYSPTGTETPVLVPGLSNVVDVCAGWESSMALESDGTVWCWGYNGDGELGNGSTQSSSDMPAPVSGLTDVVAIASGAYHDLALKSDGTVWVWGLNNYGQLGNGSTTNSSVPVQVPGLTGVTSIAGGWVFSLASRSDGTVWAWGDDLSSELGYGPTTDSTVPVQVSGLSGVTSVAAGTYHSLALKSDGTVWALGDNDDGALGNGIAGNSSVPVQVSGLSGSTAIAGGWDDSLALKSDGTVWDWGDNESGELGDGSTTDSRVPVQVIGLTGVIGINSGGRMDLSSIAVKSDGSVWNWGDNRYGQLGNGSITNSTVPVEVIGLTGMTVVANGAWHNLAVQSVAPLAPTSLSADAGLRQVSLTWTPSPGAIRYNVYRGSTSGGERPTPIATGVTTRNYTNTGLTNGRTYYYEVAAANAGGTSGFSNEASATPIAPPSVPMDLTASAGDDHVVVAWASAAGATSYNVYRGTVSGDESTFAIASDVTTTRYTDTGLLNGETYFYKVDAVNSVGTSAYSMEAHATPMAPPPAPIGLKAVPGNAEITVSWSGSTGAKYDVYRGTVAGGESSTAIATGITSTGYTNTHLTDGTTYYYEVAAMNAGGTSGYSNEAHATPTAPPAAPTSLTTAAGDAEVSLAWSAVAGATSYDIYSGTSAGGEKATPYKSGVTSAHYVVMGRTNGTTYYYRVAAVNAGGTSGYSNEASATPVAPPTAPTSLTATAGNDTVTLTWIAPKGATSYHVYRGTTANGESTTAIAIGVVGTQYTDATVVNGETYYYKVAGVNAGGRGAYSNEASAMPVP